MITRKLFLHFPKCETEKPIVYHLVKDYHLIINIFRAKVTADEEGYLVLDVTGEEACIECLNCLDNCPFGVCSSAF